MCPGGRALTLPYRPHFLDRVMYPATYLLGRPSMMKFNRLLLDFAYRVNGFGVWWKGSLSIPKNEERAVTTLLQEIDPKLVFDVGANIGDFSRLVQRASPTTKIIAFEPQPKTYDHVTAQISGPDIQIEPLALSDFIGEAELFDTASAEWTSVASLNRESVEAYVGDVRSFTTKVTTVDAYCAEHGIESIDLLKIDAEGHDLHVMRGAREMRDKGAIRALSFEFTGACFDTKVAFKDILTELSDFDVYRILANGSLSKIDQYEYRYHEILVSSSYIAKYKGSR